MGEYIEPNKQHCEECGSYSHYVCTICGKGYFCCCDRECGKPKITLEKALKDREALITAAKEVERMVSGCGWQAEDALSGLSMVVRQVEKGT